MLTFWVNQDWLDHFKTSKINRYSKYFRNIQNNPFDTFSYFKYE